MSTPTPNSHLLSEIDDRRALFDEHLDSVVPIESPTALYQAARHLFDAGGKRIRPVITLLATEAITESSITDLDLQAVPDSEGRPVDIIQAAYALEVIHTFSLIHDDIMDQDQWRRGVPAVHHAYDETTAILSGDLLYAQAQTLLIKAGATPERTVRATELLAETTTALCEGQMRDIEFATQDQVSVDDYLSMVHGKTASLFGAAAALPAVLLGASNAVIGDLYTYGIELGTAFQICDDVLDLTGSTESLGKDWGSDLVERKRTLIAIHALEQGVSPEAIYPENDDPAAIRSAVDRLERQGSIAYARTTAAESVDRGIEMLCRHLSPTEARQVLESLGEYIYTRTY